MAFQNKSVEILISLQTGWVYPGKVEPRYQISIVLNAKNVRTAQCTAVVLEELLISRVFPDHPVRVVTKTDV